ncbi:TetR/AcrR family transcriptional regulator [Actinokineospora enzanensis]|uniref:TetR/AcrR family transcriptional regulator n=1 Tax=Actinokineospora enzanensis TaxID=155975 RepID=UPI0003618327|nr:helix-turn-helix domain-containing protein [Actinokineospora enzanensis]
MNDTPGPRPARRPTRADGRRNYDAILREARAAFAVNGASTSLEEIARAAGVAIGTLYGHFATRESLVEAGLRDSLASLLAHGSRAAQELPPSAALVAWMSHAVEFCGTYRGLVDQLSQGIQDPTSHWHAGCVAMNRCGAGLLRAAQAVGEVRADLTPGELFDAIGAAAWVRESSIPGSVRLLELVVAGMTRV